MITQSGMDVLKSVIDNNPKQLTNQQAHEIYQATGKGVDVYRDVRPYVYRFQETYPRYKGNTKESALFHAWLVGTFTRQASMEEMIANIQHYDELQEGKRYVSPQITIGQTPKPEAKQPEPPKQPQVTTAVARPKPLDETPKCLECGDILIYTGGRKPRYCSDACKMKAYRNRQKSKSVTKRNGSA